MQRWYSDTALIIDAERYSHSPDPALGLPVSWISWNFEYYGTTTLRMHIMQTFVLPRASNQHLVRLRRAIAYVTDVAND